MAEGKIGLVEYKPKTLDFLVALAGARGAIQRFKDDQNALEQSSLPNNEPEVKVRMAAALPDGCLKEHGLSHLWLSP